MIARCVDRGGELERRWEREKRDWGKEKMEAQDEERERGENGDPLSSKTAAREWSAI